MSENLEQRIEQRLQKIETCITTQKILTLIAISILCLILYQTIIGGAYLLMAFAFCVFEAYRLLCLFKSLVPALSETIWSWKVFFYRALALCLGGYALLEAFVTSETTFIQTAFAFSLTLYIPYQAYLYSMSEKAISNPMKR